MCFFLAIIAIILVGIIVYMKLKLSYWNRMGLPTLNPRIPFGNAKKLLLGRCSLGEQLLEFHEEIKAKGLKHAGIYVVATPFYMTTEPEIIKHILQTDFQHFVNHGNYIDEVNDPMDGHLFNLEGAKWRRMRIKLTPTFTSGKMKMMFPILTDCASGLTTLMEDCLARNEPIDVKDLLSRFTTDVIGSAGFGLECNSLKDPNSLFYEYCKKVFEKNPWEMVKFFMPFILPRSLLKAMKFQMTKPNVVEFFTKIVGTTVAYREKHKIHRKDFMHLLLELKNRGFVMDDGKIMDEEGKTETDGLTMNELIAQSYVFFVAGFETASTTMTLALFELTINPLVQDKLREEINIILGKHDDQMTYEAIMEMTYMDKVLNETLRIHPPVPFLIRQCTKDYLIPGTSVLIEEGIRVLISTLGIHTDPEYYPDPEVFDPERFSEDNKSARPPFTWLPFGEGPRMCIGLRFGMLESKVGLVALLKDYKITLSEKTKVPIAFDKTNFLTTVEGGVWVEVKKLS